MKTQVVPVEPTKKMLDAFDAQDSLHYNPANKSEQYKARHAWKAMLEAAPTLPIELPSLVKYESTIIPKDQWRNMPIDYWLREMLEHCDYHDGLVIKATLEFLEGLKKPAQGQDEINTLKAENEKLREAIQNFLDTCEATNPLINGPTFVAIDALHAVMEGK